jgi:DNA repair exonuclease SbcCD ATPase subunit|tara:strand:+ start:15554 stop:17269 length:1716 start_codon:yes stop_codon:yes gene_type:complete
MLIFRKLRYKNFLSTGDSFTEIALDRSQTTLVVGKNGAGKSTMTDALSFALFGKPHRNITKPQLINSINGKGCVAEVEFDIGKQEFRIVRGIKPVRFEIYQNGTMINQESNARDYQKFLELNIIKMNHKSFHQIVVLGSSSFIPFMQLPANHRREVIEDLLDINIFSKMNTIMKDRLAKNKEHLKDVIYQNDLIKEKIDLQQSHITKVTKLNQFALDDINTEIEDIESEIDTYKSENEVLTLVIDKHFMDTQERLSKENDINIKLVQYAAQFKQQMNVIVKDAKFYTDNDDCPSCGVEIDEHTKNHNIKSCENKAAELSEAMSSLDIKSNDLQKTIEKLQLEMSDMKDDRVTIRTNNLTILNLEKKVKLKRGSAAKMNSQDSDVSAATTALNDLISVRETIIESKSTLSEEQTYFNACNEMLKDTGIKTKIIKEYLPVMNTIVNKYLQILDFFVDFNIDENFNETIRSRYRDAFSYSSFSEGEKMKIDISLLFAWRQIAKLKNSAATNLLILDETFDSSLDQDSVDNLMKIMDTLGTDTNTFVISHKGDMLMDKFRSKIEFTKSRNFSVIK